MSKIKYTEEMVNKAVELRLSGKTIPEITEELGIKKPSLQKMFQQKNIKLNPEQKSNALAKRWADHEPIQNGHKWCSQCEEWKSIEDFHKNNKRLSGLVSACKDCYSLFYEKNAERIKSRVLLYAANNRDVIREKDRNCYNKNKKLYITKAAKWTKENPEKAKEIHRNYDKRTQPAKNARTALYRAIKIQATPKWLTEHQLEEIKRIYINCPPGFQVDHIVPLRGKGVRGLHVPWNLQYLTALDNNKKSNKL